LLLFCILCLQQYNNYPDILKDEFRVCIEVLWLYFIIIFEMAKFNKLNLYNEGGLSIYFLFYIISLTRAMFTAVYICVDLCCGVADSYK
jgi:hypothetical protein